MMADLHPDRTAWRRIAVVGAGLAWAMAAHAEPAGPPAPVKPKLTPAEQAIGHAADVTAASVADCQPKRTGEIVVCARSPYRLPLPDERPSVPHPGEFKKVDIGTGPVPTKPGITIARFGMSKAAKTRNATLKLIYEAEAAKAAAAEKAKAALQPAVPPAIPPGTVAVVMREMPSGPQ